MTDQNADDKGRTVACRPYMHGGTEAEAKLEASVQALHKIVFFATEAIALLVREDVENGVASENMLRLGDHGLVNSMFNGVVSGRGPDDSKHPENHTVHGRIREAYHRIHGDEAPLVPGKGLGQMISLEAKSYKSLVTTSLKNHFVARVKRYCKMKLQLDAKVYKKLSKAEKTAHALRVASVVSDVCRPSWKAPVSDQCDAGLVTSTRMLLGMESIEWSPLNRGGKPMKKTLFDVIKSKPHLFFKGMAAMAHAFDEVGERIFRIVPMRSSLTPRFVTLDQRVLKEVGLVGEDAKKRLAKSVTARRDAKKPFKESIDAIQAELIAAKLEWKQVDLERNAHLQPGEKPTKASEEEQANRKAIVDEIQARINAVKDDPKYVSLCDAATNEKRDAFEAVFDLTHKATPNSKALKATDASRWLHSMKSDGVSARVLLSEKPTKGTKRDVDGKTELPRRGLITVDSLRESLFSSEDVQKIPQPIIDELDGLSAQDQNEVLNDILSVRCDLPTIVGGDPGMWELLRLSNPDLVPRTRKHRDALGATDYRISDDVWKEMCGEQRCGYTLKQRREESAPARYFLKKRHENDPERKKNAEAARAYRRSTVYKPQVVLTTEQGLSQYNSNGPTSTKLMQYLQARSAALPVLQTWYADPQRRLLRWKRFISEQRSFSQFCNRIRLMMQQREDGSSNKPLVIAYGAKGMSNGLVVKGIGPCINTGLAKKLSREFLMVFVPEHYTSQRCFHCKGKCENHKSLAERDRRIQSDERLERRFEQRLRLATTPVQRTAAKQWFDRALSRPCEIRGLRFCSGCQRCLNRDANSAPQMAVQLKRLLLGAGPLYKQNKTERQVEALETELGCL